MALRRILVVLALVASACGGGGGGGGGGEPSGEPAPAAPSGPLVVLVRYGGLAGTSDRVSVDVTGQATIVSDRAATPTARALSPADLGRLRTALERSDIATLNRNYLDPRAVDAYQYDVTYQGITVTADEEVVPPTLRPVVDQLVALLG